MKVFFSEKQCVTNTEQNATWGIISPSARKPRELAAILSTFPYIELVEPQPLSIEDFKLCHDPDYVDGIMNLQLENGFGSKSQDVVNSLPYTNGAMYDAACAATPDTPACALVSGFHHAGYNNWSKFGYFCTFNGLAITAFKLINAGKKVAIIDCDQHWGNGTHDILKKMNNYDIFHYSFGKHFFVPKDASSYLLYLSPHGMIEQCLKMHESDVILYQAGADVHVNDPTGGVLTTEQMQERDLRMFSIAKRLEIPIAWNLAGGYQIDDDGSIQKVIDLHLNTFKAADQVFALSGDHNRAEANIV